MLRPLGALLLAFSSVAAFADAYTAYDNEQSRQERAALYPYPIRSVANRLSFIQALTKTEFVSYKTAIGHLPADCALAQAVRLVSVTLPDGRVCTSPAPTSCESRTVSCD